MKNHKRSKNSISINHLPDEILMEILKRVSVTDLLKYCRVCQKWRDLISSKHFKDMQSKFSSSSPPMVLVSIDNGNPGTSRLLLLQNIWDKTRKRLSIRKFNTSSSAFWYNLICTYQGLVIYYEYNTSRRDLIILNPVSEDKFIVSPPKGLGFTIFGMFFNTWINEYCILWGSFKKIGKVRFKMFVIGAKRFKDLKPPNLSIKKPRFPPVIIDDSTLYWLLRPRYCFNITNYVSCKEVIMAFDIKKEEFSSMPHPGSTKFCSKYKHTNMHIVKIGGYLSFVRLKYRQESFIIKIWSLKDFESKLWEKTHKVCINKIWDGYVFVQCIFVMAVENGEVLLNLWTGRGGNRLYAFDLKNGNARKIGTKYNDCDKFYTYVPSFVSLPK